MKSALVKLFGFPATLIHGDTLVLDRWIWLKQHLPAISNGQLTLLDVGCGTGAFTIGAALRGYKALGLSWDERDQQVARQRAPLCGASSATFDVQDVRELEKRPDLAEAFDLVICCENIEHIIRDEKLIADISHCLKAGGKLLLTTPSFEYKPITSEDEGPFLPIEDGRHVRRGYTAEGLAGLFDPANLKILEVGYCSGLLSQKATAIMRKITRVHWLFAWLMILPIRPLVPIVDPWITRLFRWPGFSITVVALKC